MSRPIGTLNYETLDEQITAHLLRHGPMDISRLIALVRHNARGEEVHNALHRMAAHPQEVCLWDHSWHNGRRNCTRACVRLPHQKSADYVAVPRGQLGSHKRIEQRKQHTQQERRLPPAASSTESIPAGINSPEFEFLS